MRVGFPPEEALRVFLVLGRFAAGCAVEQQQFDRRTAEDHEADRAVFEQIARDERYPVLRAIAARGTGDPNRDSFATGLRWLLAGLRTRLAELLATAPPL